MSLSSLSRNKPLTILFGSKEELQQFTGGKGDHIKALYEALNLQQENGVSITVTEGPVTPSGKHPYAVEINLLDLQGQPDKPRETHVQAEIQKHYEACSQGNKESPGSSFVQKLTTQSTSTGERYLVER